VTHVGDAPLPPLGNRESTAVHGGANTLDRRIGRAKGQHEPTFLIAQVQASSLIRFSEGGVRARTRVCM